MPFTTAPQRAFTAGAIHLLAGLLKTDVVCRATEEYPDNKRVAALATRTLLITMSALDYILTGTKEHPFGKSLPSTEILSELQFANAHFERSIGFR